MHPNPRPVLLIALGLALLALPSGLAALPEQAVVAGPGAWVSTFATQALVVEQDGALAFTNADIMHHDVVSVEAGADDRPWCAPYAAGQCPLFWSQLIGGQETTPVLGLDQLEPGTTYGFYCSIHPGMTGTLVAVERLD